MKRRNSYFVEFINNDEKVVFTVKDYDLTEETAVNDICEYIKDKEEFKEFKFSKVAPIRGHHICKYCGGIANSSIKDELCDECKMTFGHSLYTEL